MTSAEKVELHIRRRLSRVFGGVVFIAPLLGSNVIFAPSVKVEGEGPIALLNDLVVAPFLVFSKTTRECRGLIRLGLKDFKSFDPKKPITMTLVLDPELEDEHDPES